MKQVKITIEYEEGKVCEYRINPDNLSMIELIGVLTSMMVFLGYPESIIEQYINTYIEGER